MNNKPLPSFEELNKVFELDPTCPSGLRWKKIIKNGKVVNKKGGKPAGNQNRSYWRVGFGGVNLSVHRIVYFMNFPEDDMEGLYIDHIDGDGSNNLIENLRLATVTQNNHNSKVSHNSPTGLKGITVHHRKWGCFWRVRITVDGIIRDLGKFNSVEDAREAYNKEIKILRGDFARLQ